MRHVQLVRALVVQFAVAGLPEPVPVVVDQVAVVLFDASRAAPEVPVQVAGRIAGLFEADAAARLAGVAVGDLQLAELAVLNGLVQRGVPAVAAILRAVLDDDAVFLPGLEGHAAFDRCRGWPGFST